jgi:hypothetical protein
MWIMSCIELEGIKSKYQKEKDTIKKKCDVEAHLENIKILVGFGRACAPVRCAHPSFWAHCHA